MLTIGSRVSQLALRQARWVASRLEQHGRKCRIEIIKTTGDKITDVALSKIGAKGLFTKEIEEALSAGAIDLAVHSMKDLPTVLPPGLAIGAVTPREDARDAVVGRKLAALAPGARVGTSSLRRAAQLRLLRPDLVVEPMRGNLDTRLRKLDAGRCDAIVVAAAGLNRLGWQDRITELLPVEVMCPAVGQGALAIETRLDDPAVADVCRLLDHPPTRAAVVAERAALAELGGGCQVPVGAHATVDGETLSLTAVVISPNARNSLRRSAQGALDEAEALGRSVGRALLEGGAQEILEEVYGSR